MIAIAVLDLILVLACFSQGAPEPGLVWLGLLLSGLLLELVAFDAPELGSLSSSPALWLLAAALPALGPRWAALGLLAGLAVRQLGRPHRSEMWLRLPGEALPGLLGLAVTGRVSAPAGLLAFGLTAALIPWSLSAGKARWWLWQTGLGTLAVLSAPSVEARPWLGFWVLPVGLGLQALLWPVMGAMQRDEPALLGLRPAPQARSSNLLLALGQKLWSSREPGPAMELILRAAQTGLRARSAVIFLSQGDTLSYAAGHTPERERLQNQGLLALSEPVVEKAWEDGGLACACYEAEPTRLMEGEPACAAIPLERCGVLYVGRAERRPLSAGEGAQLEALARLAGPVLTRLLQNQADEEALQRLRGTSARLSQWVERLGGMLEGVQTLASTLERAQVIENLKRVLTRSIPHDHGWLMFPEREECHAWGAEQTAGPALRDWARVVLENGVPLLLTELQASRFGPVLAGQSALMVAPVGGVGVLAVGVLGERTFLRMDQHLLSLAGSVAAMALDNSQLYADVVRSQAELVQAGKMVAVGKLAAGVAHEINNPLMAMLMNVELLERVVTEARARACVQSIHEGVQRCQTIVRQLLDFSRRPEPGEDVRLGEVVETVLEVLLPRCDPGIEEGVEVDPQLRVRGRRDDLGQVLANLVNNARDAVRAKFGNQPGGAVAVRVRRLDEEALLEVEDNGVGIPHELQSRIYEPFFTTKEVGKGTGLGLYLAYTLVGENGGRLSMQSRPGQGTRFQVSFPLSP